MPWHDTCAGHVFLLPRRMNRDREAQVSCQGSSGPRCGGVGAGLALREVVIETERNADRLRVQVACPPRHTDNCSTSRTKVDFEFSEGRGESVGDCAREA